MNSRKYVKFLKHIGSKYIPQRYFPLAMRLYFSIQGTLYRGNNVHCPCCNKHYRTFLPYNGRQNAMCPGCASAERHRLLWLFLNKKTDLFSGYHKVLHIAPEFILQQNLVKLDNIDYINADLDSPQATTKMDITALPVANEAFDVILCSHVLEHIPDDRKALRELRRVLKPNGWAILNVPIDDKRESTFEDFSIVSPEERLQAFGQDDHVRIYGVDYEERLREAGFAVNVDSFAQTFDETTRKFYGLMSDENIYYCTCSERMM